MLKLKMLDLGLGMTVVRFYIMMVGTVILSFLEQFTLAAIWAVVLAVSAILGMSIKTGKEKTAKKVAGEIIPIKRGTDLQKAG